MRWTNPYYINEINWKKFWRLIRKQKRELPKPWYDGNGINCSSIYNDNGYSFYGNTIQVSKVMP